MAAGETTASPHVVAFGPKDANARSAANIDAANNGATVTVNNIGADRDDVLDIAVQEVQKLPVPTL